MKSSEKTPSLASKETRELLINLSGKLQGPAPFDKNKHDSESRLKITTLFLTWYFSLIAGTFIFTAIYNFAAAYINKTWIPSAPLTYLEVTNTVAIITTTLSSGVGFVIGYYFKNKTDKD